MENLDKTIIRLLSSKREDDQEIGFELLKGDGKGFAWIIRLAYWSKSCGRFHKYFIPKYNRRKICNSSVGYKYTVETDLSCLNIKSKYS